MSVENRMHDTVSTAMDSVLIPKVEMAAKSITGSAGHGTSSEVQNPDRRDFLGSFRNTLLMSASSRLDKDIELNGNDETRNDMDFEDGDFPALKSNYDRREHTHHTASVDSEHLDASSSQMKAATANKIV